MRVLILLGFCLFIASNTKEINVSRKDHFLQGEEFSGVLVSDNKLKLGFDSKTIKLSEEQSVYSGCISSDGTLYAGTGSGKIYRIRDDKAELSFDTKEYLVTDMATSGDFIFASTIPNGKIFRMGKEGKWEEFIKLGSTHPWRLITDGTKLIVGCGKPAKIYEIDKDAKISELYSPKADHVFALEFYNDGLLIGTANPGYLISLKDTKPFVLYDFANNDVKDIKKDKNAIYVAVNQRQTQTPPEFLKCFKPQGDKPVDKNPSNQDKKDNKKEEDPISGKWAGTIEEDNMGMKSTEKIKAELKLEGKNVTAKFSPDKKTSEGADETMDLKGTWHDKKLVLEGTKEEKLGDFTVKITLKMNLTLVKADHLEGDAEIQEDDEKFKGKVKLVRVEKPDGTKTGVEEPKGPEDVTNPLDNATQQPLPVVQSQSALWKFTDSTAEAVCEPAWYITSIAVAGGEIYLGSNQSGRVFRVENRNIELCYDFDAESCAGLVTKNGKPYSALLACKGAVGFPSTTKTKTGTYVSKVFDTKFLSKIGNVNTSFSGKVELYVRGGNTQKPEDGWTDWIGPVTKNPSAPSVPKVRFIQFKIVINGDDSFVDGVTIYYKIENQRPKVTNIQVPAAINTLQPSPVQAPDVTGQKINRMTTKTISWQAQDPDGDMLVYRLYYRSVNSSIWTPVTSSPISQPSFGWNTENVADGRYVLKVVAWDETNHPADFLQAEAETEVFVVDNTKPHIEINGISKGGDKVTGVVTDNLSNIIRIEYQINGGEWTSVKPKDQMFDSPKAKFELELTEPKEKNKQYVWTIMAADSELNSCVTTVITTVPAVR